MWKSGWKPARRQGREMAAGAEGARPAPGPRAGVTAERPGVSWSRGASGLLLKKRSGSEKTNFIVAV